MGLDTSHGAWSGPYSSFGEWRKIIAKVAGFPPLETMEGFGGGTKWDKFKKDPLVKLLNHSDCDGEIKWKYCGPIADRLQEIIPNISTSDHGFYMRDKTAIFIDGCRCAFAAKENLEFH